MISIDQLLPKGKVVTITGKILDSEKCAGFVSEMNMPDDKSELQQKTGFSLYSYGFNDAHRERRELAIIIRTLLKEHLSYNAPSDVLITAINLVNTIVESNATVINSDQSGIDDNIFTEAVSTLMGSKMGQTITPELITELTGHVPLD